MIAAQPARKARQDIRSHAERRRSGVTAVAIHPAMYFLLSLQIAGNIRPLGKELLLTSSRDAVCCSHPPVVVSELKIPALLRPAAAAISVSLLPRVRRKPDQTPR
jgi:hypothetical protein